MILIIIIIIIISTFINSARVTQCHNGAGWRQRSSSAHQTRPQVSPKREQRQLRRLQRRRKAAPKRRSADGESPLTSGRPRPRHQQVTRRRRAQPATTRDASKRTTEITQVRRGTTVDAPPHEHSNLEVDTLTDYEKLRRKKLKTAKGCSKGCLKMLQK